MPPAPETGQGKDGGEEFTLAINNLLRNLSYIREVRSLAPFLATIRVDTISAGVISLPLHVAPA